MIEIGKRCSGCRQDFQAGEPFVEDEEGWFYHVPCLLAAEIGEHLMVAWDLPDRPLPPGYRAYDGRPAVRSGLLRDGFDKDGELEFLALAADTGGMQRIQAPEKKALR